MITIGIVDDEENARRVINKCLERYCDNYDVLFETMQFQETIDNSIKHQPDLIFLDINLLDGSGIDVAQQIQEKTNSKIIFTTAYNEYAIQALKLKAFDYLLKPIDLEEFQDSLKKVCEEIYSIKKNDAENSKIAITTLLGTQLIDKCCISHFNAEGSYTEIVLTNSKNLIASKPLKFFENLVVYHPKFLKIHKSTIINIDHVLFLDRINNEILMINDKKLSIARSNIKQVFALFNQK
ncbi:MAG: response regulator transcription factor [Flavobacteriia bacterium]|nr:response regulator transcription factor [Flavobacteriia bacterium]